MQSREEAWNIIQDITRSRVRSLFALRLECTVVEMNDCHDGAPFPLCVLNKLLVCTRFEHQFISVRKRAAVALKIAHSWYRLQTCHTPSLSCLVRFEDVEDITSGDIWPQLVYEKELRVSHLKKKEVAYLMGGTGSKRGGAWRRGAQDLVSTSK